MWTASVDIGIPCSSYQSSSWWSPIMGRLIAETNNGIQINGIYAISSALPDRNKNKCVGAELEAPASEEEKRRNELTDSNRMAIAHKFMNGPSDWLFFIDDDTVPPKGAISHLLSLKRDFVGGVYFLGNPPHNPVAYYKRPDGLYNAVGDYNQGCLSPVDSIGMGCTLIHKSVFQKIMDEHTVFQRPSGSLYPVHKDKILTSEDTYPKEECVVNGVLVTPLKPVGDDDNRPWPFFVMEYGRTEDHYFCELAANVGIRPYLDTTVICEHWKVKPITRQHFLEKNR